MSRIGRSFRRLEPGPPPVEPSPRSESRQRPEASTTEGSSHRVLGSTRGTNPSTAVGSEWRTWSSFSAIRASRLASELREDLGVVPEEVVAVEHPGRNASRIASANSL